MVPGSAQPPAGEEDDALRCLAVGAFAADPGRAGDLAAFLRADESLGPLSIRRSFDPSLPGRFADSAGAGDVEAGVYSFVSWKPPGGDHRGAARGEYDDLIRAWARSTPGSGVFGTVFHEPENDMTAAEFVALQRHVYTVVKDANPGIRWGPVYMAYWWDPAEPGHYVGDPQAWWPGVEYADFVGLDWYGPDPQPMTASPSFEHWYDVMAPTDLPLFIVEYGQYELRLGERSQPALEQARAAAIRQDAEWIAQHPQIRMWMYWQGPGHGNRDWRMLDEASQSAWRDVVASGCTPPVR